MPWISIREYARLKRLTNPQVVYTWIATGKCSEKGIRWREVEEKKKKKQIYVRGDELPLKNQ